MKVAVASKNGETVAGHIGKCKGWIVFTVNISNAEHDGETKIEKIENITLPKEQVFHYYKDETPHILGDCDAVIGASAGESFVTKMALRGIKAVLTAETDPIKAVTDYIQQQVVPPKPRPIGELVCKVRDAFSSKPSEKQG